MSVGEKNKRLTIRTNTPTLTSRGGTTDVYASTITLWGSIEPLSAQEKMRAHGLDATVTHKAEIGYNSRVTHDDQILYNSRTFEITSILNPREANVDMQLTLTEAV